MKETWRFQPEGKRPLAGGERVDLVRAERRLAEGLALFDWWRSAGAPDAPRQHPRAGPRWFHLASGGQASYGAQGFVANANLEGLAVVPVMGAVQKIRFMQVKAPAGKEAAAARAVRDQLREFVLGHFLSSTRSLEAQAYPALGHPPLPAWLRIFSWNPPEDYQQVGVWFRPRYYKRRDGVVGRFHEGDGTPMQDLRELGRTYLWIIAESVHFDAALNVCLKRRREAPRLVIPLGCRTDVALCRELIVDESYSGPGLLGCFGPGFVFVDGDLKNLSEILPAFEAFRFRIDDSGRVGVETTFVCRWPHMPPSVFVEIDLGSFLHGLLKRRSSTGAGMAVNAGLDPEFLFYVCVEQCRMVLRSLSVWNRVPNWLDREIVHSYLGGRPGS